MEVLLGFILGVCVTAVYALRCDSQRPAQVNPHPIEDDGDITAYPRASELPGGFRPSAEGLRFR